MHFTDIHTHILPGIDDGAKNLDQSLDLLGMLECQNVSTVVLTPHYYGRNKGTDKFLESREGAFKKLAAAYGGKIKLVRGCECNISTCANSDFSELRPLAIESTRYILTEMSFEHQWTEHMWGRLERLLDTGLIPIIAHVEKYPAIIKKPQLVHRLVEEGCLIQINCHSVLDEERFALIKALIDHGQVHCLGSDTHNKEKRPPRYMEAVEKLSALFGQDLVYALQVNMQNILADNCIEPLAGTPVTRTLLGKYK